MDHECFSSIRPIEFLDQAWTKTNLKHRAKKVLKMINRFNNVSKWVSYSIVRESNLRIRNKIYNKFLELSWVLFQMQNFSSAVSVVSGLDNASVFRLKYTKEKIPEEQLTNYNEVKRVMDTANSFKTYRDHLAKSVPPCIPHIGILLTDLVYIQDGNLDIIDDRLINFHKRRLMIKNILSFNLHQTTPYNYQRVDAIQDYLKNGLQEVDLMDEDALFELSLKVEPRGWDGISTSGSIENN